MKRKLYFTLYYKQKSQCNLLTNYIIKITTCMMYSECDEQLYMYTYACIENNERIRQKLIAIIVNSTVVAHTHTHTHTHVYLC